LKKAVETEGFSIVEVASLCTSYAFKKLPEFLEVVDPEEVYENPRKPTQIKPQPVKSLINPETDNLSPAYQSYTDGRKGVIIAGSAGGGVQSVGKFLATAGIKAGLNTTMKGEYPITVGTGFSVAEVILDKNEIHYTGLSDPDFAVIVTEDGWNKVKNRLTPDTKVYLDASLEDKFDVPVKEVVVKPFGKAVNPKSKALLGLIYMLQHEKLIDLAALKDILQNHRLSAVFMPVFDKAAELD
jgi:Pyruvate/2-oxoacid:ferredoxin oxidoreductase gamma subunit